MEYMETMMQNQYDAQNQLIMELDGTRMERDQLKAERDALAAQLVAIQDAALKPRGRTRQQWIDNIKRNALGITARQHLAEIRAEAIECELDAIGAPATKFENQNDYFVAGFNYCAALLQRRSAKLRQGAE
jgi:hypothetical protein